MCDASLSYFSVTYYTIFTAQCTLVHLRSLAIACRLSVCPSVCPSVRLSVCNVGDL